MASLPLAKFLAPGMRLGKYQLIRQLAIGGMAEVYLARANGIEGFQKKVVLKRILPQYATNEDFVRMFLSEARLAATLDHPNVVSVYDIGSTVGNYYFTMEYIRGQDVRAILKNEHRHQRSVPLGNALAITRGLCAGLHYAHEKCGPDGKPLGIVHRDVSLSNIFVSYDGAVKILDFGVAKVAAHESQTRAGTLKGKIAYMSPEQCQGESLDRRSDVFAIGIILYELTTGTRLFTGDNEFAILQKIATKDVEPPSVRRANYPAALEQIVLKALRRDRNERYQSAQELQRALETFARDERLSLSNIDLSEYMKETFADAIATEPSDSAVSYPVPPPSSQPKRVMPLPAPEQSRIAKGKGNVVPINGDVHTAMFAGPTEEELADGTAPEHSLGNGSVCIEVGSDEAADFSIVVEPAATARQRPKWQLIGAAVLALAFLAGGAGALLLTDAVAGPGAPHLATTAGAPAEPLVRLESAPTERKRVRARRAAADEPQRARRPHLERKARKRLQTKQKAAGKSTWNPDSALPPM